MSSWQMTHNLSNMLQIIICFSFSSFLSFPPSFLSNHPTTSTALQQDFQIIFSFPHKLLQLIIHPTTSSSFYFLIHSFPVQQIPLRFPKTGLRWGGICRNSNHTAIYQSDPHFVCWLFSSNLIKYRGHVGGALARRSWPPMVIPLLPLIIPTWPLAKTGIGDCILNYFCQCPAL